MIVSHKHKFIFIKPQKVAGTSVQIALAKLCGDEDVITSISEFSKASDTTKYEYCGRNEEGYNNHMSLEEVRDIAGDQITSEYFIFTIVRNPFDRAISRYFWNRHIKRRKILRLPKNIVLGEVNVLSYKDIFKDIKEYFKYNFKYMILNENNINQDCFYFWENGELGCDYYIRYENLEKDYKEVCKNLGIPYERLPNTKNKQRKDKEDYSYYFDKETKVIVSKVVEKELNTFNYKF